MTELGITGSTGTVGGLVARELAAAGLPLRLVVRDPSRAPELPGASVRQASYRDAAAVQAALEGVEVALMVSAAESADRVDEHRTFIDAAVAAGVRHLVYTSFDAAAPDSLFTLGRDHWATEEHLRSSGISYTLLRDNFYSDFLPLMAVDGVIRGPAGDGRLAPVAQADVAAVAARVLQDPGAHVDATYQLTGPEALSLAEAAVVISAVTGDVVRYVEETLDEAYASRAGYGAPDWQVDAWVSTYTAIGSGVLARVSPDVPTLLGRPALSLADVLRKARPAVL
ncbi:NAD(P)H-binding protein [Nakamurella sp. YIM 132087]|uniref:NAD(P)H-binding protein n=1 Tax=Nakamurella alba TaxID=2665158 RepID=A0A7K1FLB1_9ACTN|nr:SDR family oxidoreductase [Nakamurella alba]MTD14850.1 NAD(P)H-binding protein [Nakamurella alba]